MPRCQIDKNFAKKKKVFFLSMHTTSSMYCKIYVNKTVAARKTEDKRRSCQCSGYAFRKLKIDFKCFGRIRLQLPMKRLRFCCSIEYRSC